MNANVCLRDAFVIHFRSIPDTSTLAIFIYEWKSFISSHVMYECNVIRFYIFITLNTTWNGGLRETLLSKYE